MSQVKVKFCGITNADDGELAVKLGAWAVGLNMWPGSKRYVELAAAAELGELLKRRTAVVGVFCNQTLDEVVGAAEVASLSMLQFHGDEGPVFCQEAARRTGCKVIKAARIRGGEDLQALAAFRTDYHLVDSYVPGVPGGSGETFAWELLAGRRSKVPLILAGGLTPENVAEAVALTRPFAVDVASGVEGSGNPRRKDPQKMADFAWAVAQ
jgi:phosphoribosylanthranilate isomerase